MADGVLSARKNYSYKSMPSSVKKKENPDMACLLFSGSPFWENADLIIMLADMFFLVSTYE